MKNISSLLLILPLAVGAFAVGFESQIKETPVKAVLHSDYDPFMVQVDTKGAGGSSGTSSASFKWSVILEEDSGTKGSTSLSSKAEAFKVPYPGWTCAHSKIDKSESAGLYKERFVLTCSKDGITVGTNVECDREGGRVSRDLGVLAISDKESTFMLIASCVEDTAQDLRDDLKKPEVTNPPGAVDS